ncbi:hypothetical protein [Bifidobacterium tissieri]|uniref:hypothetical protein n=1 Tax=Bifidobacterium tissieri TaxID=1630162 RepID=UPI0012394D0B|nr:hypothetical protein [Bifidobacterium tissieri]KAA8832599.1 hypothetical protein EM849_03585 [Bifidobacterium tissieri]
MEEHPRLETKNVTQLFDIERAEKGKEYPAGTVLIQLSASDGQVHYQDKAGPVSAQYATLVPKEPKWARYLYECVKRAWPAHYARTNQGINYPHGSLLELNVTVHASDEDRERLTAMVEEFDREIERERRIIEQWKNVKKHNLATLFP